MDISMPLPWQDEEEKSRAKEEKRQAREDAAAKTEERRQAMAAEGRPFKGRPRKNEVADGESRRRTQKKLGSEDGVRGRCMADKGDGGEASERSDRSMGKDMDQKKRKTKDAVDKDKVEKKRKSSKSKDAVDNQDVNQKKSKSKDAVDNKDVNQKKRKTKDAVDNQDVNQKKCKTKGADEDNKDEDCGTDAKRRKILDNMTLIQKTEIVELDTALGDRKSYTVAAPQEKRGEVKAIGVNLQSQSFYVNKVVLARDLWPGDMAKLYKVGAELCSVSNDRSRERERGRERERYLETKHVHIAHIHKKNL